MQQTNVYGRAKEPVLAGFPNKLQTCDMDLDMRANEEDHTASWILQYAVVQPTGDPADSIRGTATPPYATLKQVPDFSPEITAKTVHKMVVVSGVLNVTGQLEQLSVKQRPDSRIEGISEELDLPTGASRRSTGRSQSPAGYSFGWALKESRIEVCGSGYRNGISYLALLVLLCIEVFLSCSLFSFLPGVMRTSVAATLASLPILFSGLVFSGSFSRVQCWPKPAITVRLAS